MKTENVTLVGKVFRAALKQPKKSQFCWLSREMLKVKLCCSNFLETRRVSMDVMVHGGCMVHRHRPWEHHFPPPLNDCFCKYIFIFDDPTKFIVGTDQLNNPIIWWCRVVFFLADFHQNVTSKDVVDGYKGKREQFLILVWGGRGQKLIRIVFHQPSST